MGEQVVAEMNIVVVSCRNFNFTQIKEANLNKQRSTHENTCYKCLVLVFLDNLIYLFHCYMFSHSLISFLNVARSSSKKIDNVE